VLSSGIIFSCYLFAFVCSESLQHLQSLVLWSYGKKKKGLSHLGFSEAFWQVKVFIGLPTRRSTDEMGVVQNHGG